MQLGNPEDPHFNYTAVKTSDLPKENKKGEKLSQCSWYHSARN
jgi:hypothetical protein